MAIFAISDLHLSFSVAKPMDIFGSSWHNYTQKIYDNWQNAVSDDDLVIIGGDTSWAMYLAEAKEDFAFINSLNGTKLISRGNHDYWWSSKKKLCGFTEQNGFDSINFLQNDSFLWHDAVISGTRGWLVPSDASFTASDVAIYERELIRLELSLSHGKKQKSGSTPSRHIVMLHYPPVSADGVCDERIKELFLSFGVTDCVYGHLHGPSCAQGFCGRQDSVNYYLSSADHLLFNPLKLD